MFEEYPFRIEFITMPLEYTMPFNEVKASDLGVRYFDVYKDISMKITAITYYADKATLINTINFPVLKGDWKGSFDGSMFIDNFLQSSVHGKPTYIEFIVYPAGCYPCKWAIKIA